MARPRRSQETRQRLIELGVGFFAERGYHGTGLQDVLGAAGAPKGSFYNYFSSKEDYAAHVIEDYVEKLLGFFDAVVRDAAESPVARLRAVHRTLAEHIAENEWRYGCLLGSLSAEIAASSDRCRTALQLGYERWRGRIADLLREGQERGEVRADVPADVLAAQFWITWQGALLRMQFEQSGAGLQEAVDVSLGQLYRP